MVTRTIAERLLQTYTFNDILEYNDVDETEVLVFCLRHNYLEIPDPKPIDLDDDEK